MNENELILFSEDIQDEFYYYVEKKFGNGPKSKTRALEEAIKKWISNEKHSIELNSLIKDLDDTNGINRPRHAAHALREFEDKKAVKALIKCLKNKDLFIRRKAAISLGYIKDESSIKPLIKSLNDVDPSVRDNAVWSLSEMGEISINPLIDALSNKDKYVRSGAASSINRMELLNKFANLNNGIIAALGDEYNVVRRRTINTIEKLNHKDNVITNSLIKTLEDKDLFVKQNSLITLGKIGNENSIEYIIKARTDEDSRIHEAAEQAWSSLKERIVNNEI